MEEFSDSLSSSSPGSVYRHSFLTAYFTGPIKAEKDRIRTR
jgi:hypothetical protein